MWTWNAQWVLGARGGSVPARMPGFATVGMICDTRSSLGWPRAQQSANRLSARLRGTSAVRCSNATATSARKRSRPPFGASKNKQELLFWKRLGTESGTIQKRQVNKKQVSH